MIFSILYFSFVDPGANPTGLCERSQWTEWCPGVHIGGAGEGSQGEGQPAGERTQEGIIIQQGRDLYQSKGAEVRTCTSQRGAQVKTCISQTGAGVRTCTSQMGAGVRYAECLNHWSGPVITSFIPWHQGCFVLQERINWVFDLQYANCTLYWK